MTISTNHLKKLIELHITQLRTDQLTIHFKFNHKKEYQQIFDQSTFLENVTFSERLYCILNGICEVLLCPTCKKKRRRYINILHGYAPFCSRPCSNNSEVVRIKISKSNKGKKQTEEHKSKNPFCNGEWQKNNTENNIIRRSESLFEDRRFKNVELQFDKSTYIGEKYEYGFMCKKCTNLFKQNLLYQRSLICDCCNKQRSTAEVDIYDWLSIQIPNSEVINSDRQIIGPKELDIYIPEKNLAIEFNGLYWHSELFGGKESRTNHLRKTELCEEQGIQLIHIFENEWMNKQEIVKSVLLSKLGVSKERIFARKCEIKAVSHNDAEIFLIQNHLQGSCISKYRLGLYHQNELVSLLTIGHSRFNKKYDFEIHRYCNKLNVTVLGGFAKLLKAFRIKNIGSIITYADRRYSNGQLYKNNNFKQLKSSSSNYWYWKNTDILYHRVNFQKHKLKDKLEIFDPNLTEWENMLTNKYDRIWDCGNLVFEI